MKSEESTIAVAVAANQSYSIALCISIFTLLEHLHPEILIALYVMSSDIKPDIQRRLEKTWGSRVQAHWIYPDDEQVCTLVTGTGHTASPSAYYRLFIGSILPASLTKVIYLDVDILVQADISCLWQSEMNGNIVLAVQDTCIQTNHKRRSDEGFEPYFNSGVMVIDLAAWRQQRIEACCIDRARYLRRSGKYNEQEALNECLCGHWELLPCRWNRQSTIDLFPDWQSSPYEESEFQQIRQNPAIIHFTTATKPWMAICDHSTSYTEAYRRAIARAGWIEWQPGTLTMAQKAREFFARPHRRLLHLGSAVIRAKRRRHAASVMLPVFLRLTILHPWTLITVPLAAAKERLVLWTKR